MTTPLAILTWAFAPMKVNIAKVERICDDAAAAAGDEVPPLPPDLATFAEHDLESQLLGCLQVRPGGLDPNTPSRTREWLWRGLSTLMDDDTGFDDSTVDEPTKLELDAE